MKRVLVSVLAILTLAAAVARAQMPDLSQMSGVPLPTSDLPAGSVSVRVVRGNLSNNVVSQPVELRAGGDVRQMNTDQDGRAVFSGLAPGTAVRASTTLDGQRLESQEFPLPATGGVRLMLVGAAAGAAGSESPAGGGEPAMPAAQPGTVALSEQSRFIIEVAEGAVEVYSVLEIINGQQAPVQPQPPLVFQASPDAAGDISLLQGSSPLAKAEGKTVRIDGPIPPGRTLVQFGYTIPYTGASVDVRQAQPIGVPRTAVLIRKLGDMTFSSRQVANQQETTLEGLSYYVGNGPGIPAGGTLDIELRGLPHHSPAPRYIALALALLVVAAGLWMALGEGTASVQDDRRALEVRREQLFADLIRLTEQHLSGRVTPARYESRRRDALAKLEAVYARIDEIAPDLSSRGTGAARDGAAVEASLRTRRA